jgi:hypothetical protein
MERQSAGTRTLDPGGATGTPSALPVFLAAGLALLATPPVVFALVGLAEGMGMAGTLGAVVEQYGARRLNLFMVAVLSFLPLLFLALLVFLIGRFTSVNASRRALALGGSVAIVAVMIWVNFEFWPAFLPERSAPGFPHGLEFVIGPLYFAPVAMLAGMVAAGFLARSAGGSR